MRMVKTPDWPANRLQTLLDRVLDGTGLNKAQLAALVGMNPSQVSRWYNGSTRPRFETLTSLGTTLRARYPLLGVGPAELTAAAGYYTDDAQQDDTENAPTPADLPEIENPTEREKFLMNYIASMHAEMRTISAKVEALEERDRLREEGGSAHKKGA